MRVGGRCDGFAGADGNRGVSLRFCERLGVAAKLGGGNVVMRALFAYSSVVVTNGLANWTTIKGNECLSEGALAVRKDDDAVPAAGRSRELQLVFNDLDALVRQRKDACHAKSVG